MDAQHVHLALLDRYVRIPTISRQVSAETVTKLKDYWRAQGLMVEPLLPANGEGVPALFAEIPGPADAPTLLIYGHYDVQPPGPLERWDWGGVRCDPFIPTYFHEGRRLDLHELDDRTLDGVTMVARGCVDNKGQHLAHVLAALAAARAKALRWRVRVLLDGEEEHGSPHLPAIVQAHHARVAADVCICSDGPKQQNRPTLMLGARGVIHVHLSVENGQPTGVHSGNYGNLVPSPVLPLANVIEDLDGRVRAFAIQHGKFREEAESEWGGGNENWLKFLWPSVNAYHFASEGTSLDVRRLVIPRAAHAKVDIRLTPDTSPGDIAALVEQVVAHHAAAHPGLRYAVRTADGQPACYTPPTRPEFLWLRQLLEEVAVEPAVVIPILGGTLPIWVLTALLGIPTYVIPSANSDNQQHDANEHYLLRHFFEQVRLSTRIVSSLP